MPPLYFESAAVIITLVLLGKYLEKRASFSARDSMHKLLELQPLVAEVIRKDGQGASFFEKVCFTWAFLNKQMRS